MAASLSVKPLRILLHKCNLKAHNLFIKLLTSKPCPKRRHFNTIPLCLSRYTCKEKEAHKGKQTWCSLNGAWVTTSTYKQAIVVASPKKPQSLSEMRARRPIRPLCLMGNVSRKSRCSLQAKFQKQTCPLLAIVGTWQRDVHVGVIARFCAWATCIVLFMFYESAQTINGWDKSAVFIFHSESKNTSFQKQDSCNAQDVFFPM